MTSMQSIGLQHPITVRFVKNFNDPEYGVVDSAVVLVAGRHRLEGARRLGWGTIACSVVEMDERQARMWEIAENLHRADLTKLERDKQIAEWIGLAEAEGISSQVANKSGAGRPESGISKAARELGIDKDDAYRAVKVASLSEEAQDVAREVRLDDNRSALLRASTKPLAEQANAIRDFAEAKAVSVSARTPTPEPNVDPAPDQLKLPAPDNQTTTSEPETDSPLTTDEWATLGGFVRRIIAYNHAEAVAEGNYSPEEIQRIERFNQVHGARIFAQDRLELSVFYWAFDIWQREFKEFKKTEARAARKKGRSR